MHQVPAAHDTAAVSVYEELTSQTEILEYFEASFMLVEHAPRAKLGLPFSPRVEVSDALVVVVVNPRDIWRNAVSLQCALVTLWVFTRASHGG